MYTSDALANTRGARIPHLLGVKNYSNNYFPMYKRLAYSRMRFELA